MCIYIYIMNDLIEWIFTKRKKNMSSSENQKNTDNHGLR